MIMKRLSLNYRRVRLPTPKDHLFKDDSDWWHNAHFNLAGKSWGTYSAGYKNAADLLARRFIKNWQGNDVLIYPMVFLYRHCLELRLKELIILGQRLLTEPYGIQQTILESHRLTELWTPCRKILERTSEKGFWPKDPATRLDIIEKLVKEFHAKDPFAMNFRYPVTRKSKGGQPTLPHLNRMGVRNLYNVMQRLDSFFTAQLDGIYFWLQQGDLLQ
jgi:hypothetical protein